MTATITLSDLVLRGEHDDHPHAPSGHTAASALEWLGLAVGELPWLTHSARTVDDLNWRSNAPNAVAVHLALLGSFGQQLASSAALLHHALLTHVARHPSLGDEDAALADVDFLARTLVEEHPPLARRADLLLGGYVSALAAAVQAAGRLGDAQLAGAGRDAGPDAEACATLVWDGLTRALATLLGHARLNERDRDFVSGRAE